MAPTLTTRERVHLKARAHALEPVVQVGHSGVTDAVIKQIDEALTAHELIKVRAGAAERDDRAALAGDIAARADAAVVQQVGKVIVLWRPRPDVENG